MNILLSWIVTPLHILLFVLILVSFHIPLVLAKALLGQRAFDAVQAVQNLAHLLNMKVCGTNITVKLPETLPANAPILIVANHQSMYDIPLIIWNFRRYHPRFIAKVELQRFIPTISFSLRAGGHLIINRNDPKSAVKRIEDFASLAATNNMTICIFPEGTRAKDGKIKPFKVGGLLALIQKMQNGYVIPVAIDGSWKLVRDRLCPFPYGETLQMEALAPLSISEYEPQDLVTKIEETIHQTVTRMQTRTLPLHDKLDSEGNIVNSS